MHLWVILGGWLISFSVGPAVLWPGDTWAVRMKVPLRHWWADDNLTPLGSAEG